MFSPPASLGIATLYNPLNIAPYYWQMIPIGNQWVSEDQVRGTEWRSNNPNERPEVPELYMYHVPSTRYQNYIGKSIGVSGGDVRFIKKMYRCN